MVKKKKSTNISSKTFKSFLKKNTSLLVLLLMFFIVVVGCVLYFFLLDLAASRIFVWRSPQITPAAFEISPTPIISKGNVLEITIDPLTASWKEKTFENLLFRMPNDWDIKQYEEDDNFPKRVLLLGPEFIRGLNSNTQYGGPVSLGIEYHKDSTLTSEITNEVKRNNFIDYEERTIHVNSNDGIMITGHIRIDTHSSYQPNVIKLAFFARGNDSYLFRDTGNKNNEDIFNQILSTFTFTD